MGSVYIIIADRATHNLLQVGFWLFRFWFLEGKESGAEWIGDLAIASEASNWIRLDHIIANRNLSKNIQEGSQEQSGREMAIKIDRDGDWDREWRTQVDLSH